jgi:hypothetical protein
MELENASPRKQKWPAKPVTPDFGLLLCVAVPVAPFLSPVIPSKPLLSTAASRFRMLHF